jgi:hypothetical protein
MLTIGNSVSLIALGYVYSRFAFEEGPIAVLAAKYLATYGKVTKQNPYTIFFYGPLAASRLFGA